MTPIQQLSKVEKLAALRESLANPVTEPLFDAEYEKNKAKVRHRALLLLDQRARSVHELTERLLAAELEPALVHDVVADLRSCGLVDDATFATEWVLQRHRVRGKSRAALDRELAEKGVSRELRASALELIGQDEESDMAEQIANKKAKTLKTAPADRREYDKYLARIVGVMARRGYPQAMCLDVGRRVLDQRIEELRS